MFRKPFGWAGLVGGILLLLAGGAGAAVQVADLNSAINKAGRQRMLSQRIAKAYLQIGQEIDVGRSRIVLDGSIQYFDKQLAELKGLAPTPEIRETYQELEKSWMSYKNLLVGMAPSKAGGRGVLELSEEVLKLAHQGTVQLEKHSNTSAGRLVNIAGRQRMLSQRMAKLYQALGWGVAGNDAAAELERARRDFVAAHEELKKAAAGNAGLKDSMDRVGRQWIFLEAALAHRGDDQKYYGADVAAASELILQEMEVAVSLFEKQAK